MRKIAGGIAAVTAVAGAVVLGQGALQSADAAGTCPNNNWANLTKATVYNNFAVNGVNIRTGDSTSCTSLGQGQTTHDTALHCYSYNGSYFWDHLKDLNTGTGGWVREGNLRVVSGNQC